MNKLMHFTMKWASLICALLLCPAIVWSQTNLKANVNGMKVDLTWDLPDDFYDKAVNDFEGNDFPGEGWTVKSLNTSDYRCSWFSFPTADFEKFENYTNYIHSGRKSSMVFMDIGKHTDGSSSNQDEWLISPEYTHATNLEFYSFIDPMLLEYDTYENYEDHYYVKVSHDDGKTWEVIWDARKQCSPEGGWQLVSLPLGHVSGSVRVAFNAVSGKASAKDHLYFLWAIDDVRISGQQVALSKAAAETIKTYGYYNVYKNDYLIASELNARQFIDYEEKVEGMHTYRVTYFDETTQTESQGAEIQVQIYAPTYDAPRNVKLTHSEDPELGHVATLTWDAPAGKQKPEGYVVYLNGVWVGYGLQETTFENTGLTKGLYEYEVAALYEYPRGESKAVGDVIAIETRIPVRNLYAEVKNGNVDLSWDAPVDKGYKVKGYDVYRSTECIATCIASCSFTDLNVSPGFYDYTVIVIYEDEVESMASAVSVTVGEIPVCKLPFVETFDTPFKPANWQIENLFEETELAYLWRFDDWYGMGISGNGFSGNYASIDGLSAGYVGVISNLLTPPVNIAHPDNLELVISYDLDFMTIYEEGEARLEYSNDKGATWMTLSLLVPYLDTELKAGETCKPVHMQHSLAELGHTGEVLFRWYYNGNMDGHIAIDNVGN